MKARTAKIKRTQRMKSAFTAQELIKYSIYFLFFVLFGMTKFGGGIAPFNLGFFVALIFCKENILILSPLYVLAMFVGEPAWITVATALMPPLILGIAQAAHHFLRRPIKMLTINLYAFLSQLPILLMRVNSTETLVNGIISVAVSQIFTYCCIIICYAVLIRGLKYKFSTDEIACACIFFAALFLGLYNVQFLGFRPYYLVMGFMILFSVYMYEPKISYIIGFMMGIGAGLAEADLGIAAAVIMATMTAQIFSKSSLYFSALSIILIDLLAGIYFKAYGDYTYLHLIAVVIGVAAFLCVPRKYRERLLNGFGNLRQQTGLRTMINRNRADVTARLTDIGKVFDEMHEILDEGIPQTLSAEKSKIALSQELALKVCASCPDRKDCFQSLGSDTSGVLIKIIDAAFEKGKATLLDIPTFLSSRCGRINTLLSEANGMGEKMKVKKKLNAEMALSRSLLSSQMGGVANMLYALADDIKKNVTFDGERERRVIEELSYHNIIASEVMVFCREDGEMEVDLIIRQKDRAKKAILGVVSKIMKTDLIITDERACSAEGFTALRLSPKPKYDVVYGEASLKKEGSSGNGDTRSVMKINQDKFMIVLCDGMGSGSEAYKTSSSTISMIEHFYRAGFGNEMVLNLINRLLSLKNEDDFSALDICVIDLKTGGADFIKMGAPDSVLMRSESMEVISGSALPLGILEEISPEIQRKMLLSGDMIVLVSDGITDVLGSEGILHYMENNPTINPQTLAENLMLLATKGGNVVKDDSTVLAARIYANVG